MRKQALTFLAVSSQRMKLGSIGTADAEVQLTTTTRDNKRVANSWENVVIKNKKDQTRTTGINYKASVSVA